MIQNKKKLNNSLLHYVSFSILSMIGLSYYILADTFFISNGIGNDGLTALNIVIPIYSIINATGLMLGMGGGAKYSIAIGEKNRNLGSSIYSSIMILGVLIGSIFTLLGILLGKPLLALLGADATIMGYAYEYFITIVCFSIPFILNTITVCFVRNDGNPNLSMIAMLVGSGSNVILDYFFIYPMGLGMFGAAFATGLSPIISLCILSLHFIQKKNGFHIIKPQKLHAIILHSLSLGLPSFINELSSAVVIILFNYQMLRFSGNMGVASYGIIANIALVGISIFTGIGQGIQPLLSKYYGKKDTPSIKYIYKIGLFLSTLIGGIIYVIIVEFRIPIAIIFSNGNQDLIQFTEKGMILYFTSFLIVGFNIITSIYYSSIDRSIPSFFISISRGLLFITISVLVLPIFLGITGIWISILISELLTLLISIYLLLRYKKKRE